jgi:SAM-dependent methyltransferase
MLKKAFSVVIAMAGIGTCCGNLNYEEKATLNLLNYVSKEKWGAYYTLQIGQQLINGQRDQQKRLSHVPYDFSGKTVLDIGANSGGMLLAIADKIRYGVGIEFNSKLVNVANKLKSYYGTNNLDFYVFDLDKEPLGCISDFLKAKQVDICFLLSVTLWIKKWKEVIDYAHKISKDLLFEATGSSTEKTRQQMEYLQTKYNDIKLLSPISDDDAHVKGRKLYFCSNKI